MNRDAFNEAGRRDFCGILHLDQAGFCQSFCDVLGTMKPFSTLTGDMMGNRVRSSELSVEPSCQLLLLIQTQCPRWLKHVQLVRALSSQVILQSLASHTDTVG